MTKQLQYLTDIVTRKYFNEFKTERRDHHKTAGTERWAIQHHGQLPTLTSSLSSAEILNWIFVFCHSSKSYVQDYNSLTAILASAVLIEVQVSSRLSKMMMNFTPGCRALQTQAIKVLFEHMHFSLNKCILLLVKYNMLS